MRKLLKHDLKSVFNGWWISSLSVLAFFIVGTVCVKEITIIEQKYYQPILHGDQVTSMFAAQPTTGERILAVLCSIGLMLTFVAAAAYIILNLILVLRRYYTNLFTDQGYLTFTLPVSRMQILFSKLMMGFIYMLATSLVVGIGVVGFSVFGTSTEFVNTELLKQVSDFFKEVYNKIGGMMFVYIAEVILCGISSLICTIMFYYSCITVGSVLVKKFKILVAIGIYYIGNMVISFATWMFILVFIDSSFLNRLGDITDQALIHLSANALLLLVFGAIALIAATLYCFNLHLLNKKLNLA